MCQWIIGSLSHQSLTTWFPILKRQNSMGMRRGFSISQSDGFNVLFLMLRGHLRRRTDLIIYVCIFYDHLQIYGFTGQLFDFGKQDRDEFCFLDLAHHMAFFKQHACALAAGKRHSLPCTQRPSSASDYSEQDPLQFVKCQKAGVLPCLRKVPIENRLSPQKKWLRL